MRKRRTRILFERRTVSVAVRQPAQRKGAFDQTETVSVEAIESASVKNRFGNALTKIVRIFVGFASRVTSG